MKLNILLILIILITLPLAQGQEEFIKTCKNRVGLDFKTKKTINALAFFFQTEDCTEIARKLSTVKSFHEFIAPARESIKSPNLLFPWTDDFPLLYGLKESYTSFKTSIPSDYSFNDADIFQSLDLFSEFKNITVVSLLPTYNYFKNTDFNVCQFISKFPNLKIVTIESKLLLNPEIDKCLSDSKIDGVILRDIFGGFEGEMPITKIIGIEFYKGNLNHILDYGYLKYLGISNETKVLSGVEALASLSDLTHFSMNIKAIKDISKIGNLINLTYLNLTCIDDEKSDNSSNQRCKIGHYLSEISFLNDLPWLEHLNLSFSNIDNLGNLSVLTKLKYLKLRGNNLTNISNIGELPNLTYLDLSGNKLEDIQNIKAPQLKFLSLSGNKIRDFSPLQDLAKLEFLNLSNNTFNETLTGSIFPSTLRGLNLNGGGGSLYFNKTGLKAYTETLPMGLAEDHISHKEVLFQDTAPQAAESKMNSCAAYPLLGQLPDLSHLKNLEVLSVKNNNLAVMPDFTNLSKLKYLNLAQNNFHSLTESLLPANLTHLDFSVNELTSFPVVSSLKQLKRIDLRSNNISDLALIKTLPDSVTIVGLEYNLITDSRPIIGSTHGMRTLFQGYITDGNPVTMDARVGRTFHVANEAKDSAYHKAHKCPDL